MDEEIVNKVNKIITEAYGKRTITNEAHQVLIERINKGDKALKVSAARALSRIGNPEDFQYVISILNIEHSGGTLIEAVATYGIDSIRKLRPILENATQSKYLRENIIKVFVFNGSKEFCDVFISYLNDKHAGVRRYCIRGIEIHKLKQSIEPLENLISNEKDELIKKYALSVYKNLVSL